MWHTCIACRLSNSWSMQIPETFALMLEKCAVLSRDIFSVGQMDIWCRCTLNPLGVCIRNPPRSVHNQLVKNISIGCIVLISSFYLQSSVYHNSPAASTGIMRNKCIASSVLMRNKHIATLELMRNKQMNYHQLLRNKQMSCHLLMINKHIQ